MQGNLFGAPSADWTPPSLPYAKGSETSKAAAEKARPRSGTQRDRIYVHILVSGDHGSTDEEGQEATGISPNAYRPRRGELAERGLIHRNGQTRPTASGAEADVWVAT